VSTTTLALARCAIQVDARDNKETNMHREFQVWAEQSVSL